MRKKKGIEKHAHPSARIKSRDAVAFLPHLKMKPTQRAEPGDLSSWIKESQKSAAPVPFLAWASMSGVFWSFVVGRASTSKFTLEKGSHSNRYCCEMSQKISQLEVLVTRVGQQPDETMVGGHRQKHRCFREKILNCTEPNVKGVNIASDQLLTLK